MTEMQKILGIRNRCETEGREAQRNGTPQYECPYHGERQHEEFSAWMSGWWRRAGTFIPLSQQVKPYGSDRDGYVYFGNPNIRTKVA